MKNKTKFLFSLLLAVLLLASLSAPALAAGPEAPLTAGGESYVGGTQERTVFAAGQTVRSDAEVRGLLLAAGYSVNIGGSGEYVLAAGYNAAISGSVSGDVLAAGYSVGFSGNAGRDAYLSGNDVAVTGSVGHHLFAAAKNIVIDGEIAGDVNINAETVTVGPDAAIGGTLRYNSSAAVSIAEGSRIAATEVYASESVAESEAQDAPAASDGGSSWWSRVSALLGSVALAFVLLWLTPLWETVDGRYTGEPFAKYAAAFGIGFGVLAGVPLVALLLMISGIGLRLAFVLLLVYAAALLAAPGLLAFFLGGLIWRRLLKKPANYWAELPIGLLLLWLAKMVPGLSFVVGLVAAPFGLGVITLLLGKGKKPAPTAAEPAIPAVAESGAEQTDIAAPTTDTEKDDADK